MILGKRGETLKNIDRRRDGHRRACRLVPVLLFLIILTGGCKEGLYTSLELPEESQERKMGIRAGAVYLSEPDEISDLFNSFLPSGGVLPVLVTVRNDDDLTMRLHSRNGLPLRDDFSGILLHADGDTFEPIHPLDVVRIIGNNDEGRAFRKADGVDVVTGALLPPLGLWYAWEEYRSRREFKPLVEASLLPARYGGVFEPLTLSPGQEASGYLYFVVDPDDMPYDSVFTKEVESDKVDFSGNRKKIQVAEYRLKEDWDRELTISFRPAPVTEEDGKVGSWSFNDSLPSSQVFFPEGESPGFFALVPRGKGRSLVYGRPDPDMPAIVSRDLSVITDFSSGSVEISGAAVKNDLAVVAVHFTRRSKVMVVDLSGGAVRLLNAVEFERKTEKVFFLPGEPGSDPEIFAFTSDNFCRVIPVEKGEKGSYMKIGNDVKNIAVNDEGRLFVFAGDELRINKKGSRRLFEPASDIVPGGFDIEVVGEFGERLVLLGRGRKGAGDSLRVFDTHLVEEVSVLALPTRVALTGSMDNGLLVHLDEGTLLDIGIDSGGNLFIRGSAYFSGRLTAMTANNGSVTLFRGDGVILTGNMGSAAPIARHGGSAVPVDMSSPRPR